MATDLTSDPTHEEHVGWAAAALTEHSHLPAMDPWDPADNKEATLASASDLLTDLFHLVADYGIRPRTLFENAIANYDGPR
jgi:hypothetical protein